MRIKIVLPLIVMITCYVTMGEPVVSVQTENDSPEKDEQIQVILTVKDATDIDTYSISISFDSEITELRQAAIDDPFNGLENVLKIGRGKVIPVIKKDKGTVNISATLTGNEPVGPVTEVGILGILLFSVKETKEATIKISKAEILDNNRKKITPISVKNLTINEGDE